MGMSGAIHFRGKLLFAHVYGIVNTRLDWKHALLTLQPHTLYLQKHPHFVAMQLVWLKRPVSFEPSSTVGVNGKTGLGGGGGGGNMKESAIKTER